MARDLHWSGPARRVAAGLWDRADAGLAERGEFEWAVRVIDGKEHIACMILICPGCKMISALPLMKPSLWPRLPGEDWHWNGNIDRPTLSPSIHHVGCWHGHLVDGVLKAC